MTKRQLVVPSWCYPWDFEAWYYNQHVAVFYRILTTDGAVATAVPDRFGQDSHGTLMMPLAELTLTNASPLVLKAKKYLINNEEFDPRDTTYAD